MKTKLIFILIIIIALSFSFYEDTNSDNTVNFLDVGEGDGTHIRLENSVDIIIDGGPDNNILKELGKTLPIFDKRIEYLIMSHADYDHMIGLIEIAKRYTIGEVLIPELKSNHENYLTLMKILEQKNIEPQIVHQGDELDIYNSKIKFFWPEVDCIKSTNYCSLIFSLTIDDVVFLFTGDADIEAEEKILGSSLKSDVLKVGHHGSASSTSDNFLSQISPQYGIISVGLENRYGHPSISVLEHLQKNNVRIIRTDEAHTITFKINHKSLILK
ncbi:MAG: MBL fold metallo-hydrolase [bacterium]